MKLDKISIDRKSTRPELQSHHDLVCRLLLEKKKTKQKKKHIKKKKKKEKQKKKHKTTTIQPR